MRVTWKLTLKVIAVLLVLWLKIFLIVAYFATRRKPCDFLREHRHLRDISDVRKPEDRSIFFLHTSCGEEFFGEREACAVEAAARHNAENEVFVLYTHPIRKRSIDLHLNAVMSYANVNFVHLNVRKFIKSTPVEKAFYTNTLTEDFVKEVLAVLILHRYGGIYLDLDMLVLKNLKELSQTFIGYDGSNLSMSIMGFNTSEMSRNYIATLLDKIKRRYTNEGNILPFMVELAQELCATRESSRMPDRQCIHFKVYSKRYFYPIGFNESQALYERNPTRSYFDVVKKSYAMKIYSKMYLKQMRVASSYPFVNLAKRYCPKVMEAVEHI